MSEIQAIMKHYDGGEGETPKERLVAYEPWLKDLRVPLEGRRLAIVKQSFVLIAGGDSDVISLA